MARQRMRKSILFFSFLLFPITFNYFSPYLMIEGTLNRVVSASLITWTFWFMASLLIGRAACSYICPFGGLQMLKEAAAEKKLKEINYLRSVKYLLWLAWVGSVAFLAFRVGGYLRIDLLYNTENVVSLDSPASNITYFMLIIIVLLPTLLGKMGFCHYFCPFGVFGILGTKIKDFLGYPSLRLQVSRDKCTECKKCDKSCPMSLQVSTMVSAGVASNTECTLCGSCVDSCNQKAISYSFSSGKLPIPEDIAPGSEF
ncbi:MAG: 4Fe-4S binding protein [Dethiobacter sp.]|nr:4Fe-4S binding protein [Dethiobacter sp.]